MRIWKRNGLMIGEWIAAAKNLLHNNCVVDVATVGQRGGDLGRDDVKRTHCDGVVVESRCCGDGSAAPICSQSHRASVV
jgi:hypothetical protein